MKIHEHVTQGSEEWLSLRRGRPTASQFKKIVTSTGKPAAPRHKYMCELIAEQMFPDAATFSGNASTERGHKLEPIARKAFSDLTGHVVSDVGFVTRDDGVVGCSPDGLICDSDGQFTSGLEIKCVEPKTHIDYVRLHDEADSLRVKWFPPDYKLQVHGGMAVTGLDQWHLFRYCPGVSSIHIIVERDHFTNRLSESLDQFTTEYKAMQERLKPILKLDTAERDRVLELIKDEADGLDWSDND